MAHISKDRKQKEQRSEKIEYYACAAANLIKPSGRVAQGGSDVAIRKVRVRQCKR
jgi:hypothetical protein